MTGKELILYILLNDLEDEVIDKDGRLVGFLTIEDFAIKKKVGIATIKGWIKLGRLKNISIGGITLIPENDYLC